MIREPTRRFAAVRMMLRFLLVLTFVSVAVATPFFINKPRTALDPLTAAISCALSLLIAAAIWWI